MLSVNTILRIGFALSRTRRENVMYEVCPESKDTKVLNIYIFNLQKQHCEWIACT